MQRAERQIINTEIIPDPNWVAGFVTGDGGFDIRIIQQSSNSSGYRVQLRFKITHGARPVGRERFKINGSFS